MQGKNCWCLEISLAIFLLVIVNLNFVSAVRINEIELNPMGEDNGKEWVELYSQEEINLQYYRLRNNDNQTINLTGNFSGFFIVNFSGQWLDNSDERVFLLLNNSIIDETIIFEDAGNNDKTWQYCSLNWTFANSTENKENSCQQITENQTNQNQNKSNQTAKIFLKLEYDEEAENGEEIEVDVKAYNLLDNGYDIKVYLTFTGNETIISETYNENGSRWKSSSYYVESIISGEGNKSRNFRLKIDNSYKNFKGDAKIKARIRKTNESNYIAEFSGSIEILEMQENIISNQSISSQDNIANKTAEEKAYIIQLNNPKGIKSQEIYKSKAEYIKEYAIYGFILFCVLLITILARKKYNFL